MKNHPVVLFPGKSEKELLAGLLRSLAVGILVLSLIFILFAVIAFRPLIPRALTVGAGAWLTCFCILWLIRRAQVQLAGSILVVFFWLIISFGAFTAGGITAPIFFGYAAVILIGALVFGTRTGFVIAVLSIAFGFFMIYAEINQFLPAPTEYSAVARLAIYAFFFFIILLLQKTAVDTTKSAILRAHTSETQYRKFLENISIVTYLNDTSPEALTTYVSPQVEKMLGYSHEEFLDNPALWMELIYPDDREKVIHENKRTYETGEPFVMEYRLMTRGQGVIWIRDEATLIRDEGGEPQYWLGIWTDITQRKNLENAQIDAVSALIKRTNQLQTASEVSRAATSILELNELLSKVVELIRSHFEYYYVGIFLVDDNRETLSLRAATGEMGARMLASKHSFVIGNPSMVGWCVENNQARIALDVGKDAVRFKNPFLPLTRSELALPLMSHGSAIGAMTIQSDRAAAFTDADVAVLQTMADQVANSIETARLFDERAGLIQELETKNAELERFSYTVSHDLKSPLVTIRGFMGYLREDARKGDLKRFDRDLARVINATDTMQNLLNDLLELSRIGRIINPIEEFSFGEMAEEALNLLTNPLLPESIKIEIQDDLPFVRCDRTRMIEVIQNLVANAIKFMGDQPQPVIHIGSTGADGNPDLCTFFVKDNGLGIESEYHERVFGLFNRLDPQIEGTGIGLTLVKRIVEVHGGRIWLESDGLNKGSTFYFTVPAADSH